MRRPRSKLQVSMFPFLAVLLCVMGALLLILFVMDRRAKIAAQHQVTEMKSARLARSKADEEARQAEWEKAKQALHLSLLAQDELLKAEAKDLESNLNDASKKIEKVKWTDDELKKKMQAESEKIALLQVQITTQQNGVSESAKKENVSKAELLDAAKELADLEFAFKKLRALKQNDKQTYSLVPYRGKHGDMRPPIYVECVAAGVLFHPEKDMLSGPYFTLTRVRSEVERRAGPLVVEKAVSKDKTNPPAAARSAPYVLFLVRPDGIENYYKAQSYLKGYQLDFGYELVDQHWALDFGAIPQPIHLANANGSPNLNSTGLPGFPGSPRAQGSGNGNTGAPSTGQIGPPPGIGLGNGGSGPGSGQIGPPPGIGFGTGSGPGNGQIGPPPGIGFGNAGSGPGNGQIGLPPGNGFGTGTGPGNGQIGPPPGIGFGNAGSGPGSGQIGPPPGIGFGNAGSPGAGSGQYGPRLGSNSPPGSGFGGGSPSPGPGNGQFASPNSLQPPRPGAGSVNLTPSLAMRPLSDGQGNGAPQIGTQPTIGNPTYNGINTGIPVQGGSFVPISKNTPPPVAIATTSDGTNIAKRVPNQDGSTGTGSGGSGGNGNPSAPNAQGNTGTPANPGNPTPNANGSTDNGAANPSNGGPPPDGSATNAPYAGSPSGSSPSIGGSNGGPVQDSSVAPPFRPLPNYGGVAEPKRKTTPPPPIGRVLGNKDFLITVDCYREHVSVFPGGMTFRWNAADMKATDKALVQSITNLIAKRQASVNPGEPPYRPMIRFQVSAEGLRTYYHAYPLLESLGVPMRRENTVE